MSSDLFGMKGNPNANLKILGVPWDVTASYKKGTSQGPRSVERESPFLDFFDHSLGVSLKKDMFFYQNLDEEFGHLNEKGRRYYQEYFASNGQNLELKRKINEICSEQYRILFEMCIRHLDAGMVGILGGEHSLAFPLLKALDAKRSNSFGILHIDAHFDLRPSYEDLEFSHASVFFNALNQCKKIEQILHIGIRDYCKQELDCAKNLKKSVVVFAQNIHEAKFFPGLFFKIVEDLIAKLPRDVYLSFDIDGLEPSLCPGTGTPVPGGLSYYDAMYIIDVLLRKGKRIIGFDLCEIGEQEVYNPLNGNVGARVLMKIMLTALTSQNSC